MNGRILLPALLLLWQAASGDVLKRGLGPEPDSLHIHQAQGLSAVNLLRDVREGLVTFNAAGEPVPGMARGWQVSESGRRYVFDLRADARWSNGDPVVAEDFLRGWRRALDPATPAPMASLLDPVVNALRIRRGEARGDELGVAALPDGRLEVRLGRPAAWFPEILAHPVSFPLHADGIDDARSAPVNGPFIIARAVPHAVVRLEPNPHHHDRAELALSAVEYFPIEDPSSELSRFRSGELHITETLPPGRLEWLSQNLPEALQIHPYLGSFWLGLNLRHAPLGAHASLRRALSLAIDRDILVRRVLGSGEVPSWSIVPPGMGGYEPQETAGADLDKRERETLARRLYREAGFGPSNPLRLELRFNTSSQHRRMAVAVSAMWKQVLGVRTELINEEWKVFVNNRRQGVLTQVFRGGWIADYADPASFLELFTGAGELNTTFYRNPGYDALLRQAASQSGDARLRSLEQAERQLLRDMPVIPLYHYVSRHLVRPDVRGFVPNVRDIHLSRYMSLESERR